VSTGEFVARTSMHEEDERMKPTSLHQDTEMSTQIALPKVSVCMIAYNHGAYIRQAIERILSQDVDFPIELVIGDDCSKDDTAAICEEIAVRDPRVRLLPREKNLGVMPNFSRTLRACSGEYIAVCEGDDFWTDQLKLKTQVSFLDSHPDYAGSTHQAQIIVDNVAVRLFKENVPATLTTRDLIGGRLFHMASVMFRRPVVDLFCNAPLVLGCDRLLNFCMSFAGRIHYSEESMCGYRLHGTGMSSNATVEQMKLELNSVPYLKQVQPTFPKYRYLSYIYAAIGLCRAATLDQKLYFLMLSFIYSFANFPQNLVVIGSRLFRTRIGSQ
jgi:glycosyltransferase involved in cell wall biosynthesis